MNVLAAWANEFRIDNPQRAERYLRRAEQLQREGYYSASLNSDSWLRFYDAYKRWLRDDVDAAFNEVITNVRRDDDRLSPAAREDMYIEAGQFMMTLGRLEDAERMFNRITSDTVKPGYLALVDFARDDMKRSQRGTALYGPSPGAASAIIGARMGLLDRARQILASKRVPPGTSMAEAIEGELALQSGQVPPSDRTSRERSESAGWNVGVLPCCRIACECPHCDWRC
jgi:hypothetical protein